MKVLALIFAGLILLFAGAVCQVHHEAPSGKTVEENFEIGHQKVMNEPLDWPVVGSILISVDIPTGLTYDGEFFLVPDWTMSVNAFIYKIDILTGLTVDFIPAPSLWPGGITWDGEYLWITDYIGGSQIFKISPLNGAIITSYPTPYSYYWAGVAWDGQYIYYGVNTSPGSGNPCWIYKIDPNTGITLDSFMIPSTYISGLTYYNGHLWYSDSQEDILYKITPSGVIVDSSPAAGPYPSGMTFANGYLWNVDRTEHLIYQYEIESPALSVSLTPFNPPIQIPSNGGSFEFNIEVANSGANPATCDIWTMATLPNGHEYGPIIGPIELTVAPNTAIDRDRTQTIPAGAPTGNYTYDAYVGVYPDTVWDEDHFEFEKLAISDGGPVVPDWNNWGESFADPQATGLSTAPTEFALYPAYPNPFNPETNLRFSIPEPGNVSLVLYDVQGKEVARLVEGWRSAGLHEVTLDGSDLSSGIYFALLTAGSFQETSKLLLIK